MTFQELLTLTAGMTVFVTAFMEGRKAGTLGTSVGLLLGLAIGFGVFWGTRVALKWAVERLSKLKANHSALQLALEWLLCLVALIGMVALVIIVSWFTRQVIHLMQ